MKRLPEMEDALERAQAVGGESASRHTRNKKSMSRGRVRREEKRGEERTQTAPDIVVSWYIETVSQTRGVQL